MPSGHIQYPCMSQALLPGRAQAVKSTRPDTSRAQCALLISQTNLSSGKGKGFKELYN